jgi:hypothetical protein
VAEREAKLILDSQLKRLVRRPLPRTSRPFGLLLVTLFPVCRGRRKNTMKIRPVLAIIPIVVGVPVAVLMSSVTAKIRPVLMLGKVSRGQQRRCG